MSDLIAFLRARLDEERALADRAAANVRDNPFWGNDWAQGMTGGMGGPGGDLGAVFSPDRVMAEVQAKRAILDAYPIRRSLRLSGIPPEVADLMSKIIHSIDGGPAEWAESWRDHPGMPTAEEFLQHVDVLYGQDDVPVVLKLLALPYQDHPDYRQEWSDGLR